MKKLIPLLLCLAVFVGCKKDNQANITGKWTLKRIKLSGVVNAQTVYNFDTTEVAGNFYLQLNDNKSGFSNLHESYYVYGTTATGPFTYAYNGSTMTFSYAVSTNYLAFNVSKTVASFDNNNLVLHYQSTDPYIAGQLEGKLGQKGSGNSYYIIDEYYSR